MVDRRRLRGEATRERLLSSARDLFGERGYEATSIDAVLEKSGVARGALYHHFASKAELFDAVAEEVFVEIAEQTAAAGQGSTDPLERLRAGSHAWLVMSSRSSFPTLTWQKRAMSRRVCCALWPEQSRCTM